MAQILIVEDDVDVLAFMERFLSDDGFKVVAAQSVEEASTALTNSDGFDVIVSDFYLQTSTAVPLLDLLSERYPTTPVILTSGGKEPLPIEAVHAIGAVSGAVSFLQKPLLRSELLRSVHEALGRR